MALTFYYGSGSPFAWKVWLTLEHKALAHEFRRLQFNEAELKSAAYLALNPRGKVPCLVDGDNVIYESNAIVEYLDEAYPERPVLPRSPVARARTRRLAAESDHYLYPAQRELFQQTLFRPADKGRDEAAIARAHDALLTELARWQRSLGDAPFFGGDGADLADFTAFPVLRAIKRVDEREPAHGLGARWPAWAVAYLGRAEALAVVQKTWPPHWKG